MKAENTGAIKKFASELLDHALKQGADMAEVFLRTSKKLNIEVKDHSIDSVESSLSLGYSLRIIKGKRLGFSYSTSFDDIKPVVKAAIDSAGLSDIDEFLDMASRKQLKENTDNLQIYDKNIADISRDDAVSNVMTIEDSAKNYDPRIKKVRKASGTFVSGELMICNSNGIDITYPYTSSTAFVTAVAEENNDSEMGWDIDGSRFLSDISFETIGRNAAMRAIRILCPKKITTIKASLILDSSVASEFLGVFSQSFSADSVQKGRSSLKNRIGQDLISKKINIIDSGIIPRKLGTSPVDDEGFPSSSKILIKEGMLESYLHNSYTAKKAGTVSTGNAIRESFSSLPGVGISNLYLEAVSKSDIVSFNSMLCSLDKGLYVTEAMGIHTANPISGEFSIGVSGLWIENGEIKFPVKEAVISGDILGLFAKIEAVADDFRFYGNIGTPSLLISSTDISA
ncbi:MAG: TldD/PmbA family protein [Nitrospiraceae bacterium]|nr:TldD/PmbA family protein [Nitrospiraceae bacterium]